MAEGSQGGGGSATPWLAFLIGGLIVVVAVIGYFMYTGQQAKPTVPESVDVEITAPQLPDAPAVPAPSN